MTVSKQRLRTAFPNNIHLYHKYYKSAIIFLYNRNFLEISLFDIHSSNHYTYSYKQSLLKGILRFI